MAPAKISARPTITPLGVSWRLVQRWPADESDHDDPEDAQQQLAPVEASARGDVHAEGRAVVLDEPQLEPVGEDDDRLVEVHVGLDPDFERLVCDEQQHDEQRYFLEIHNRSGIRLQK